MDRRVGLSTNSPQPASLREHTLGSVQTFDFAIKIGFFKLSTTPTTTTKLLLKTEQQV
jgi:hypothetical protein